MIHSASPSFARLALVAIAVVGASCSRSPLDGPPGAKLTYSQVKTVAEKAAESHGITLNDFDEPVLRFEGNGAKHEWLVYFQMKGSPPPGGHFLIVIDDATSKADYHPGQ